MSITQSLLTCWNDNTYGVRLWLIGYNTRIFFENVWKEHGYNADTLVHIYISLCICSIPFEYPIKATKKHSFIRHWKMNGSKCMKTITQRILNCDSWICILVRPVEGFVMLVLGWLLHVISTCLWCYVSLSISIENRAVTFCNLRKFQPITTYPLSPRHRCHLILLAVIRHNDSPKRNS